MRHTTFNSSAHTIVFIASIVRSFQRPELTKGLQVKGGGLNCNWILIYGNRTKTEVDKQEKGWFLEMWTRDQRKYSKKPRNVLRDELLQSVSCWISWPKSDMRETFPSFHTHSFISSTMNQGGPPFLLLSVPKDWGTPITSLSSGSQKWENRGSHQRTSPKAALHLPTCWLVYITIF